MKTNKTNNKYQAAKAAKSVSAIKEVSTVNAVRDVVNESTFNITPETTLNELISLVRNCAVEKPNATSKFSTLHRNYRCVASYSSEDHRANLFVYNNGYAAYETDVRCTIIDLNASSGVKYRTNYSHLEFERSDFDREWLGGMSWTFALSLLGEEQVSRNIFEDKAHDYVGEGDHDENEDETKKPNNPAFAAHIDDPETAYIRRETRNEIKRALSRARSKMTVKQDEAFRLYYNQDMTLMEVSKTLGIGIQSTSERLGWALKKICTNVEQFL